MGPATAAKLERLGITSVTELASIDAGPARRAPRPRERGPADRARPRDRRSPGAAEPGTKSIGHEETFAVSVTSHDELRRHARRMGGAVARALRDATLRARCVTLKVKFDDFTSITRSHTVDFGVDDDEAVAALAALLVDDVPFRGGIRLLRRLVLIPRARRRRAAARLHPGRPDRRRVASSTSRLGTARATSPRCAGRSTSCAAATARARSRRSPSSAATGSVVEPRRREDAWGPAGDAEASGDDARDARVSER